MIFFVVVGAFLHLASNARHLLHLTLRQDEFALKSSVAIIEGKEVTNMYEQLRDFNITNDAIIRTLKSDVVRVQKSVDTTNDINLSQKDRFTETIYKITAYDAHTSNSAYEVDMR